MNSEQPGYPVFIRLYFYFWLQRVICVVTCRLWSCRSHSYFFVLSSDFLCADGMKGSFDISQFEVLSNVRFRGATVTTIHFGFAPILWVSFIVVSIANEFYVKNCMKIRGKPIAKSCSFRRSKWNQDLHRRRKKLPSEGSLRFASIKWSFPISNVINRQMWIWL